MNHSTWYFLLVAVVPFAASAAGTQRFLQMPVTVVSSVSQPRSFTDVTLARRGGPASGKIGESSDRAYAHAAGRPSDPCGGPNALLSVIDRPTAEDSPCVVKPGEQVLEGGIARYLPDGADGYSLGYPQFELRFGLPHNNELVLLPPNLTRAITPLPNGARSVSSGGSASAIGIKHEFGYNARWVWAGETLVTLPSGSPDYGSAATGYAVNGIVSDSLASAFTLTLMLGTSHLAVSANSRPAGYYWSLNQFLVGAWQATDRLQFYTEIYGQSHTGPDQGAGYDADGGIQYLVTRHFEVDAEIGRRLSGNLGGWSSYAGVGFGLLFE